MMLPFFPSLETLLFPLVFYSLPPNPSCFDGNPSLLHDCHRQPYLSVEVPAVQVCVGGVFSVPHASLSSVLSFRFNPKTCFPPRLRSVPFPQVNFPAPFLCLSSITAPSPPPPSPCLLLSQSSQPVIGRVYE